MSMSETFYNSIYKYLRYSKTPIMKNLITSLLDTSSLETKNTARSIVTILEDIAKNNEKRIESSVLPNINFKKSVKSQVMTTDKALEKALLSPFRVKTGVTLNLTSYLERIVSFTEVECSTLIIALIYINRFYESTRQYITSDHLHKLLLIGIILAAKYNEDHIYSDTYYAKVGGIDLKELSYLETAFLEEVGYSLFVEKREYNYVVSLLRNLFERV